MNAPRRIMVINPGSTSTKLSLYFDCEEVKFREVPHDAAELNRFPSVAEQEEYRFGLIRDLLEHSEIPEVRELDVVIGRGGLLRPLEGGVYRVSPPMVDDLRSARYGEHACNLGGVLARRVADEQAGKGRFCEALIADPVVVDELLPEARLSGIPGLERKSIFHALNQKSVARLIAGKMGKSYEEVNLIVCHMGGGVTVGAHRKGRVIDVNNGLDGDGPFSPERSGGVPSGQLVKLALSGEYSYRALKKMITGSGGVYAYCGTKDMKEFEQRVNQGEKQEQLVYKALLLQLGQEIAKHGATLEGLIDGIILTGGLARYTPLVVDLEKRVSFLAPVYVVPGEREMTALAENAFAALSGSVPIKEYIP